jgi:DNA-binding GntR family transcriptional regulator
MPDTAGGIREVRRDTLRTRVYEQLRTAIMRGNFEPGQALTVRGLAEGFGTSPTPVREALQQLTAENALVAEPNKSYRVPLMTGDRFIDLRDTRAVLEGLAARKAARLIAEPQVRKLEQINERMLRAIAKKDKKGYLTTNESFHFGIYEAAQAPILLQTIRSLWTQIGPTLNLLFNDITVVKELNDYHATALAALRSGDEETAARAISEDILTAGAFIEKETSE